MNELYQQPLEKQQLEKRPVGPVDVTEWVTTERQVGGVMGLAKTVHVERPGLQSVKPEGSIDERADLPQLVSH